MKKRGLSFILAVVFCMALLGPAPVLADTAEGITVVKALEFYKEDGTVLEATAKGRMTASITLRSDRDTVPEVNLAVVGYETQGEDERRMYSVKSTENVRLEQGVDTPVSVSVMVTDTELSREIAYKALVWEGGFNGSMTPVVDFKPLTPGGAKLSFDLSPEYAKVDLRDPVGERIYPDDGVYPLEEGKQYAYTVENLGYVSQSGTVTGGERESISVFLEEEAVPEGRLRITTPEHTALNELEPVQLNALVEPLNAPNRGITWSIKPGDEEKVELCVPDSQADGYCNEIRVKPGVTEGQATFIATREGTGETQEITLNIREAVRTVKFTGQTAKAGSSLAGRGDDKPTGNINVGTTYVTNWSVQTDYLYWSGVIPKAGIGYKAQLHYSALNPVDGASVVLSIKEIISTETGEDGGQQYDIIGDTVAEYIIDTPGTESWGDYVTTYSRLVTGDESKLEKNKRYRFELSRPVQSSAINFDTIVFMPADYDPDAKPDGIQPVQNVRADNGQVEEDGTGSTTLRWNAYEGAQEYQIYKDNETEPFLTAAGSDTQVKITGLTQHEVYKFLVRAKLSDGSLTPEGVVQQNTKTPQEGVVFYVAQETKEHRDWRMEWFRDAKYGMMITWDPSAVFGGEYTGRQVGKTQEESRPHYSKGNFPPELVKTGAAPSADTYTTQGYAEWIMNYAKIPREIYMKAAEEELAAGQFDFREWVRIAKEGGMRYLTVITKHHDGFAIMDTNGVGYNIVDHSAGKLDVFGEVVKECRRQGMGVGAYYSQALDWLNNGGLGGIPELSGGVYPIDAQEKYINQVVIPHLRTLTLKYNVDDIWWDMGINSTEEFRYRTMKCVQTVPGGEKMIFNGRLYTSFAGLTTEDFSTPEQNVPGKPANGDTWDWEACMTTNLNWGHAQYDDYWKSVEATLFRVVNIASKGGNFLYNVGPLADGSFPHESTERLLEVGSWLQANGESIYGTTPAPFTQSVPWGRITRRVDPDGNTTLYLIVTKRDLITPTSGGVTKVTADGVTYETDNKGPFYINNGGKDGSFDAMDEDMWRAAWPEDGVISLPQMFNELGDIQSVQWLDPGQEKLGTLRAVKDSGDGHVKIQGLPAAQITRGLMNEENCQYTSDQVTVPGLADRDYAAVIEVKLNGGPDMEKPQMPVVPDANGNLILEANAAVVLNGVSLSNGGPASHPQILGNFGTGGNSAKWEVDLPEGGTYKVKGLYITPNNTNISYVTISAQGQGGANVSVEGNLVRSIDYGEHYMQTGGTPQGGIMEGAADASITLPPGRSTIEWKRGITGNVGTWFNLCRLVLEKQ